MLRAYPREAAAILLGNAVAFFCLAYLCHYYSYKYYADGILRWGFLALAIADLYLATQTLFIRRYIIVRRGEHTSTEFV